LTQLDIVVFQLPPSCTQLHDCDTSLVGVGDPETIFSETSRMVYCCWPEAMDRDACQEEQQGRLILDQTHSSFVGTHKTITIPGQGLLAAFLYDTAELTDLPQGTYALMIANCNYQDGRKIHVTGGVHWTPKLELNPPRDGDTYHTLHEQYHDGGVQDHEVDHSHTLENENNGEMTTAPEPVVEEENGETTTAPEPVVAEEEIVEEEETIDESVVMVPPGADGADGETPTDDNIELVPNEVDKGDDDDLEEPQEEETNDEPGGMGAFAGMWAAMVVGVAVVMGVIYYQYQRKKRRTDDDLDLMYAMDEGGAAPSIEDHEALLMPRGHREYRRPSYMDNPNNNPKKGASGYSHRPDMTNLSTLL
jgi:hypothetical protein